MKKRYIFFPLLFFSFIISFSLCSRKKNSLSTCIIKSSDKQFWKKAAQFPFDKNFKWGVATSAFQLEGSAVPAGFKCENSWSQSQLPQPGTGTDHWNRYKEDVQLIKNSGLNAYRFSIEWSKVNPQEGVFCQEVMDHYVDLCKELIKNGIEPIPCLFHHAWPSWFDKKGGFEKRHNITYFVQFAEFVFKNLITEPGLTMWMTFNEPVGYALEGWIRGHYPPFKKSCYKVCGKVVRNMLDAHVEIYHVAKKMNPEAQIGFPHIFMPLNSYHYFNPLVDLICAQFNYLLHDVALDYFKTGEFNWSYKLGSVTRFNKKAIGALDYIGINYYTHTTLKMSYNFSIKPCYREEQRMMGNKALSPRGLYAAIKKCAKLGVPMYITENGINDPDDIFKEEYMRVHVAEIIKVLCEGYDIRGYFWWTLMDCFEWSKNCTKSPEYDPHTKHGVSSNMGLYAVDSFTKERSLRPGAQPFVEFLHNLAQKKESQ